MQAVALVLAGAGLCLAYQLARWLRGVHRRCSLLAAALPHPRHTLAGALHLLSDMDHFHHSFAKLADELGGIYYGGRRLRRNQWACRLGGRRPR